MMLLIALASAMVLGLIAGLIVLFVAALLPD